MVVSLVFRARHLRSFEEFDHIYDNFPEIMDRWTELLSKRRTWIEQGSVGCILFS
jgi:hypothetical protein